MSARSVAARVRDLAPLGVAEIRARLGGAPDVTRTALDHAIHRGRAEGLLPGVEPRLAVAERVRRLAPLGVAHIRAILSLDPDVGKDALDGAIYRARLRGDLPPLAKVRPQVLSIRPPEATRRALDAAAAAEGTSPAMIARRILERGIRRPEMWETRG